jgi:hypothetical protein
MGKLTAELAGRDFQIVAISIDEKPGDAVAFWKRMAPPFTVLHDVRQTLVQEVVVPTMPTSYLLDRSGHVRYIHAGFHGNLNELRHEIEALLDQKG